MRSGRSVARLVVLLTVTLCLAGLSRVSAAAPTGWANPVPGFDGDKNWQSHSCGSATGYITGLVHMGSDVSTPRGTEVRAIALGTATYLNGAGSEDEALQVRHTAADGTVFTAIYGHIDAASKFGAVTSSLSLPVGSGEVIGAIRPHAGGDHLHFGIWQSPSPKTSGWGRRSCQPGEPPISTAHNSLFRPAYSFLSAHATNNMSGSVLGNFDGSGGDDVLLRRGSEWFVDLGANGTTDRSYGWGRGTDEAYIANIDGSGGDDVLLRRGSEWFVDLGANGTTDRSYGWGRGTDEAYIANIDGSGGDDVLLRRGSEWFVDLGANGTTDRSYGWGRGTDEAYIANIDGSGGDDVLLRRGSEWFVDLGANGTTDRSYGWGRGTDEAYIANIDGSGGDDVLLRRGSEWFVDLGANGTTDRSYGWGRGTDEAYIANIDGSGGDDVLLRRGSEWFVDLGANGTTDRSYGWGRGTDEVVTR